MVLTSTTIYATLIAKRVPAFLTRLHHRLITWFSACVACATCTSVEASNALLSHRSNGPNPPADGVTGFAHASRTSWAWLIVLFRAGRPCTYHACWSLTGSAARPAHYRALLLGVLHACHHTADPSTSNTMRSAGWANFSPAIVAHASFGAAFTA